MDINGHYRSLIIEHSKAQRSSRERERERESQIFAPDRLFAFPGYRQATRAGDERSRRDTAAWQRHDGRHGSWQQLVAAGSIVSGCPPTAPGAWKDGPAARFVVDGYPRSEEQLRPSGPVKNRHWFELISARTIIPMVLWKHLSSNQKSRVALELTTLSSLHHICIVSEGSRRHHVIYIYMCSLCVKPERADKFWQDSWEHCGYSRYSRYCRLLPQMLGGVRIFYQLWFSETGCCLCWYATDWETVSPALAAAQGLSSRAQ